MLTEIDGTEFTLFIDYDRGKYANLSFPGKVKYMRERVTQILLDPCKDAMKTILHNQMGLVVATAICAMISAASTFLKGEQAPGGKDGIFFADFITRYMDPTLQKEFHPGKKWIDWLYSDVRCGLAHSFAIKNGGVEYEISGYVEVKNCGPEINPIQLLEDFENGWSKYLDDVLKDGPAKELGLLFGKRFDEIFHD
jgi:hypothetical protein